MAKPIETLSIQLKFKDAGSQAVIEKLRGSLKRLEIGASGVKPRIASLRKEILAQGNASVKSVSNINAQITSLRTLRDEAKIGSRAFNQLTKDIEGLNAQLGKAQGRGARGGMGARRATQAAGAVISGGIFGGPEGAIGALGGLAAGGVEGAFAGAAIGAVVGGARQAIGETATFAAEINKLKIALEGVAGSGEDFESALRSAGAATRDLNVPQKVAISGITRLAAAVKGAGGPIGDAELTFRNVTAAIKATGGSSEDVQGAITAMVQVFSKGKVSAEELSGQLGERLPGAVTMFAKANKMTLPELQKNLKAGTVGLNELMNFIVQLGDEFGETASKIASSNEEAGGRLQVAFDEMRLQVGESLIEVGSEFQNIFGNFTSNIAPAAVGAAKLLAGALLPVAKNLDLILVSISGLAAGAGIAALITNFAAISKAIMGVTAAAGALLLNPIFAGAAAVAGIVAGIYSITQAIRNQRSEIEKLQGAAAGKPVAEYSNEERAIEIAKARRQRDAAVAARRRFVEVGEEEGGFDTSELDEKIRRANARLAQLTAPVTRAERDFKYDPITPDTGSAAGSAAKIAERESEAFNQILAKLTKRNMLESEANKFERERIKIRAEAGRLVSEIDERVADNRKQELFDLVEIGRLEALRKVDAEELDAQIKETMSMDFANVFAKQQGKIQEFIASAQDSLKDLQQVAVNVAQGIGNAIANSLVNGIQGLIDGSAKVKDVFANLLKSVGQILSQEGAKMIATYIAIGIAKAFAGMPGFGKPGSFETGTGLTGFASQPSTAGFDPSGLFGRANGGPVNAGRPYMVGERGPELFVPGQSGGIMRNEEMRRLMGRSPAGAGGGAAAMNFTFETTNIGGTEYVSREQLEAAMATTRRQAANDGAKRGMSMTLDKMQNSPRTRSRIGIG